MTKNKIIILVIVLLFILALFIYLFTRKKENNSTNEIIKTIEKYNYTLKSNQSNLYVDLFNELDDKSKKDIVDEEEIVSLVAQLFVADFYNLANKISKNDVGGLQFIHESMVDNFTLKVTTTIYKYIENNIYGNRNQKLPIVENVTIKDINNISYSYLDKKDDNAYSIDLEIIYKEDLNYPTSINIILINENDKYKIVEIK